LLNIPLLLNAKEIDVLQVKYKYRIECARAHFYRGNIGDAGSLSTGNTVKIESAENA